MENFSSLEAAFLYFQQQITEATRSALADSCLSLTVNHSRSSRSMYINLCYLSADESKYPGRYPYVIRISDHPSSFARHRVDEEIILQVAPLLKAWEEHLEQKYLKKNFQLHTTTDEVLIRKYRRELIGISSQIKAASEKTSWQIVCGSGFHLRRIKSAISAIATANPRKALVTV